MKWPVALLLLLVGFAVGALSMDFVALRAMRGYLAAYLLEQAHREDAAASAAACEQNAFEEALRRWSVVALAADNAVAYDKRHTGLLDPIFAALALQLSDVSDANALRLEDLYRAKLVETLERAGQGDLASRVRASFKSRPGVDGQSLERVAAQLVAADCVQARGSARERDKTEAADDSPREGR